MARMYPEHLKGLEEATEGEKRVFAFLKEAVHLEAYNEKAVNYNRDVEAFPVLRRIIEKITGQHSFYKSPTDMGVNRAGFGIVNDEAVREAAIQEIIRRYFRYACEYAIGFTDKETVQRVELLLEDLDAKPEDRIAVKQAREAALEAEKKGKGNEGIFCGAAMELPNGTIITGKNSPLMHAASALVLNAVKHSAHIPDTMHLLPPNIMESISHFKKDVLRAGADDGFHQLWQFVRHVHVVDEVGPIWRFPLPLIIRERRPGAVNNPVLSLPYIGGHAGICT